MSDEKMMSAYDDGNIPKVDLPPRGAENNYPTDSQNSASDSTENSTQNSSKDYDNVEPLPESTRPRKDGPGGN